MWWHTPVFLAVERMNQENDPIWSQSGLCSKTHLKKIKQQKVILAFLRPQCSVMEFLVGNDADVLQEEKHWREWDALQKKVFYPSPLLGQAGARLGTSAVARILKYCSLSIFWTISVSYFSCCLWAVWLSPLSVSFLLFLFSPWCCSFPMGSLWKCASYMNLLDQIQCLGAEVQGSQVRSSVLTWVLPCTVLHVLTLLRA